MLLAYATMSMRRLTANRLHRIGGLTAAIWLSILGLTGFLLDHRDSWSFLWQWHVPAAYVPTQTSNKATGAYAMLRADPHAAGRWLAAGKGGVQVYEYGVWQPAVFRNAEGSIPMIRAFEPDPELGWDKLWFASDSGIWISMDGGATLSRHAGAGDMDVTAIAFAPDGSLYGVIDAGRVFHLDADSQFNWIDLPSLPEAVYPAAVNLSRFVHDLHYGRGLISPPLSLLLNDYGGLGLLALSVIGFLYWRWPRKWKRQGETPAITLRRQRLLLLYRSHGVLIGTSSAFFIVYLSLTGILIDHRQELNSWMKQISIPHAWLPSAYSMDDWQGQIYGVDLPPERPGELRVGTRIGLFSLSADGWHQVKGPGFVWSMRRQADYLLICGMGSPSMMQKAAGDFKPFRKGMASDAWVGEDGKVYWFTHGRLLDELGVAVACPPLPQADRVPLFYIMDGLHSGLLIHAQWKWINDLFSVLAILLVGTGLWRVCRRGW